MEQTAHATQKPHPDLQRPPSAVPDTLVREELERILASHEFQASKLCQNFLRYTVENTLAGQSANLKERTIGIEVFGKPTSYDPSDDAGVRVKAGEVRKRLRSYYLNQPVEAKVLIDLPSGTYIPEFHLLNGTEKRISGQLSGRRGRYLILIAAAALVLASVASLAFYWLRPPPVADSLREFWSPVFQSQKPVLVCAAPVPVYSDIRALSVEPPTKVGDFALIPDQFAAIGDVNTSLQIANLFGQMKEPYKLRIGKEVLYRDLRDGPAVLVGFSYTQWHQIGDQFRYSIDLSHRPFGVSQNGALTNWTIKTHPDDPELHEDYAIVSRFFYPGTNDMIVEITGISHYGTEAAGDLVTNPTLLPQVLRKLPAGWQQKNFQIVMHVDVISGFPSVPTVVATYVW